MYAKNQIKAFIHTLINLQIRLHFLGRILSQNLPISNQFNDDIHIIGLRLLSPELLGASTYVINGFTNHLLLSLVTTSTCGVEQKAMRAERRSS